MNADYPDTEPAREAINATRGPLVLEFGAPWCGHCRAARPLVQAVLKTATQVPHLRFEDGPGQPLGRSFRVKLWPTLIFLRDGVELARVVRPTSEAPIEAALGTIFEPGNAE